MSRRRALACLACAACAGGAARPDAAAAAPAVELRDARGARVLRFARGADGWVSDDGLRARAGNLGEITVSDSAGQIRVYLDPSPEGNFALLRDGNTQVLARFRRSAGTVELLTVEGVGVVRSTTDAAGVVVGRDGAGVPFLVARREGERVVLSDRDGAAVGTVHGSADPLLALLLAAGVVPVEQRLAIAALLGGPRP